MNYQPNNDPLNLVLDPEKHENKTSVQNLLRPNTINNKSSELKRLQMKEEAQKRRQNCAKIRRIDHLKAITDTREEILLKTKYDGPYMLNVTDPSFRRILGESLAQLRKNNYKITDNVYNIATLMIARVYTLHSYQKIPIYPICQAAIILSLKLTYYENNTIRTITKNIIKETRTTKKELEIMESLIISTLGNKLQYIECPTSFLSRNGINPYLKQKAYTKLKTIMQTPDLSILTLLPAEIATHALRLTRSLTPIYPTVEDKTNKSLQLNETLNKETQTEEEQPQWKESQVASSTLEKDLEISDDSLDEDTDQQKNTTSSMIDHKNKGMDMPILVKNNPIRNNRNYLLDVKSSKDNRVNESTNNIDITPNPNNNPSYKSSISTTDPGTLAQHYNHPNIRNTNIPINQNGSCQRKKQIQNKPNNNQHPSKMTINYNNKDVTPNDIPHTFDITQNNPWPNQPPISSTLETINESHLRQLKLKNYKQAITINKTYMAPNEVNEYTHCKENKIDNKNLGTPRTTQNVKCNKPPYICTKCKRNYKYHKKIYIKHLEKCNGIFKMPNKILQCHKCNKKFTRKYTLKRHQNTSCTKTM